MKPEELRIGNWVKTDYDRPEKITAIINGKALMAQTKHTNIGVNKSRCEPIPLTEQWLKDFGFDGGNGFILIIQDDENYDWVLQAYIYDAEIQIWIVDPDDDKAFGPTIKVNHVHQLQNLYFALTGKELTINQKQDES